MRLLPIIVLSACFAPAGVSADSPVAAQPAPAAAQATPTGASSASAKTSAESDVVFGVITLSDDRKSLTIQAKKTTVTLTITDRTAVTFDLQPVPLEALRLSDSVRVTYAGTTVLAIDQLKPDKRKKKKPQ